MEKILLIVLFIGGGAYFVVRDLKGAIKYQKEEDLKESLITPKQRIKINTKQDQIHKIFIYLVLAGIFILFFLKNTFIGYFLGWGCLLLMGKNTLELGLRWSKSQPWNPKILVISFLLLLIILALIGGLYYPQMQYIYQDEIN
jgi:hypothetical protein